MSKISKSEVLTKINTKINQNKTESKKALAGISQSSLKKIQSDIIRGVSGNLNKLKNVINSLRDNDNLKPAKNIADKCIDIIQDIGITVLDIGYKGFRYLFRGEVVSIYDETEDTFDPRSMYLSYSLNMLLLIPVIFLVDALAKSGNGGNRDKIKILLTCAYMGLLEQTMINVFATFNKADTVISIKTTVFVVQTVLGIGGWFITSKYAMDMLFILMNKFMENKRMAFIISLVLYTAINYNEYSKEYGI